MKCRYPKGLTLAEILISSTLALLLMGILYQVLATGFRVGRREMEHTSAEQGLLLMGHRLKQDLQATSPSGVTLSADGETLLLHPIDSVTEGGRLLFENRLWLWQRDDSDTLNRKELSDLTGEGFRGVALRLTPTQMLSLDTLGTLRLRNTLDRVTRFQVANPSGTEAPSVGNPLTLHIERKRDDSGSSAPLVYRLSLQLRNPVR